MIAISRIRTQGLAISFDVTATAVDLDGTVLEEVFGGDGVGVNEDDPLTFSSAFQAGARGLVASGRFLGVVVGALLPFLPVIALVGGLVWWIRRRARRIPKAHSSGPGSHRPH